MADLRAKWAISLFTGAKILKNSLTNTRFSKIMIIFAEKINEKVKSVNCKQQWKTSSPPQSSPYCGV